MVEKLREENKQLKQCLLDISGIVDNMRNLPCGNFCKLDYKCYDKITNNGKECMHRGKMLIQEKIKEVSKNICLLNQLQQTGQKELQEQQTLESSKTSI